MSKEYQAMFPVGSRVLTPSGRVAIVKKHLKATSKIDCNERVICEYEGICSREDRGVTLNPNLLKKKIRS